MKTLKRTLSCFLALLMIFGSCSVLSYAALNDGNENSIEIYTKFFVGEEEVTTVNAGDAVKARVYIATDFKLATTTLFWVYPTDFFKFNPIGLNSDGVYPHGGEGFDIAALLNTSATSIPGSAGIDGFMVHQEGFILDSMSDADNLVYEGYLPEDYFDDKGWIALSINKGTPVVSTTDEWFFEFNFTVKDTVTVGDEGYFYIPEESVMNTTGQDYGFTAVQRAASDTQFKVNVNEQAYMMAYDLQLKDKNVVTLAQAEATKYAVTYSFTGDVPEGYDAKVPAATEAAEGDVISAPVVEIPEGYELKWTATGATDNLNGTYTVGAGAVAFLGTWAKTAPTEYAVTYSFSNEAPNGITAPPAGTVEANGTIAAPSTVAPAGWDLVWNVTGATKQADGSYLAGEGDVAFVGTWVKVEYTVTYYLSEQDEADGKAYATKKYSYGDEIDLSEPDVTGYTFNHWDVETEAGALYDEATMPAENLVAIANLTEIIVKFYDVYGFELEGYTLELVDEITAEDLPSADDATAGEDINFVEWQIDGVKLETPYALEGSVDVYPYCTVDIVYYEDEELTKEYETLTFDFGYLITADDLADLGEPTKTGYEFDGWDCDFVDSEATVNSYAYATWVANEYEATFTAGKGAFAEGTVTTVKAKFDEAIEFTAEPVLEGFSFKGWTDVEGGEVLDELVMDAECKTFYPVFVENNQTAYTVEIYLMGTDGKYPATATDSKTEYAAFGTTVETSHDKYAQDAWFSADENGNVLSGVVAEDGSTVLKLYYKRATVEITVNGETDDYYVGEEIPAPTVDPDTIPDGYEQDETNPWVDENGDPVEVPYEVKEDGNPTEIKPNIVAKDNTPYTVEIYLMDAEGNYPATASKTEVEEGTTDTLATAAHADYAQESYYLADTDAANVYEATITGDGKAVLELYYKRATVEITVNGETDDYYVGEEIPAPTVDPDTIPDGYEQDETNPWVDENGDPVEVPYEVKEDGNPTEIKPNIVAKDNTPYTVEIYLMDAEGNYPETADDTDVLEGTTGTLAEAAHADYAQEAWFTPAATGNVTSATITGDGKAVLKLYFERAQYDVTIDGVTTKVYHGATITAPESTTQAAPAGFAFAGWNNGTIAAGASITVTEPITLEPYFAENQNTAYTVEIYLMDAEGNYPETASKTENETGKTGDSVTIAHADYAQEAYYLADDAQANVLTGEITGDGSLVLKLYFKRATYDIVVDGEVVAEDVIHGAEVTLPETSDNIDEGNELAGWTDGKNTYEPGETIVVEGDLDLTPIQKPSDATMYTISIYVMDTNGEYVGTSTAAYGTTGTTQTLVADYGREGFTVNTEKSNLTDTIKGDGSTVLSVFYDRNIYTATFDGVEYPVYFGASLPTVEPSAQEGKEFDAWTPEVPASMPAENLEFTSTWTNVMYKLIYIINGVEEEYEYAVGATVTPIADPVVPGMTFVKWNKTIPTEMPAEDVIIVAEFEAAVFKVTFLDGDGNVFDEKAVQYGDTIVLPASNPTKEYHVFKGWLDVPETMPAANITIHPEFERVPVRLVAAEGSTTVIDRSTMIITGLTPKFNDARAVNYLAVEGDGYYTLTPVEGYTGYYGTGAKVEVYDNADTSAPVEVFYIVIYGDVNGDSAVNSADNSIVEDEVLFATNWSRGDDKDELMFMAADLNKDGKIKQGDADGILNSALGIARIDQATGDVIR